MKTTFIYILKNNKNEIFYIGKSNNPIKRYKEHVIKTVIDKPTKKYNKFRMNIPFTIDVIEEVNINEWENKEMFYIKEYSKKYDLVNYSSGGFFQNGINRKQLNKKIENLIDLTQYNDEDFYKMGLKKKHISIIRNTTLPIKKEVEISIPIIKIIKEKKTKIEKNTTMFKRTKQVFL